MKKLFTAIYLFFADRKSISDTYLRQETLHDAQIKEIETDRDKWKTELYSLIAYLTDGTWKEGDSIVESIDAFQEEKQLAIHRDIVIKILMENEDPEDAAQELFDFFGIEDREGKLKPKE